MDKETIERIIRSCGYRPQSQYKKLYSHRAVVGTTHHFIYIVRGTTARSLGQIETISAMSEEQLRDHIAHAASTFAQLPAQKK